MGGGRDSLRLQNKRGGRRGVTAAPELLQGKQQNVQAAKSDTTGRKEAGKKMKDLRAALGRRSDGIKIAHGKKCIRVNVLCASQLNTVATKNLISQLFFSIQFISNMHLNIARVENCKIYFTITLKTKKTGSGTF